MVGMCWSHWNRATLNSNNNINNRKSCRILFEFPITALVRDCLKWTFLKNGKRRKCTSTKTKATVKELQSSSQAICTIPYNRNVLHTNVRKLFGEIETKENEIVYHWQKNCWKFRSEKCSLFNLLFLLAKKSRRRIFGAFTEYKYCLCATQTSVDECARCTTLYMRTCT